MKGKPVLAAISGLLFGFFLALVLQQWSIYPLTPLSVLGLPLLGLVFGLLLAAWAPFGGEPSEEPGEAEPQAPA